MKSIVIVLAMLFSSVYVSANTNKEAFVSTWIVGDSNYGDGDLSITLPLVDYYQKEKTHTYASAGKKTVRIQGLMESMSFSHMTDLFYGTSGLISIDISNFDMSTVINMYNMSIDMSNFDISSVLLLN